MKIIGILLILSTGLISHHALAEEQDDCYDDVQTAKKACVAAISNAQTLNAGVANGIASTLVGSTGQVQGAGAKQIDASQQGIANGDRATTACGNARTKMKDACEAAGKRADDRMKAAHDFGSIKQARDDAASTQKNFDDGRDFTATALENIADNQASLLRDGVGGGGAVTQVSGVGSGQ
jgi:hypothetical protein